METKKSAGRPTCQIAGDRMKQIRKQMKLTQKDMAARVYDQLQKPHPGVQEMKNFISRIEKTGKTDLKTAQAIADVLQIKFSVLCGDAPDSLPNAAKEIQKYIEQQLDAGNEAIAAMLAEDDIDAYSMANIIAYELEYAKLKQDEEVFLKYSRLLGCTDSELRRLINFGSCWLLACKGGSLPNNPELILSGYALSLKIDEYANKVISKWVRGVCDAKIVMNKVGLWHSISFVSPVIPALNHEISFVRCEPSAAGIQLEKTDWRDEFLIEDIQKYLVDKSNFARGFDGVEYGPSDLVNLKFSIRRLPTFKECNENSAPQNPPLVAITSGILEEYHGRYLDSFKQYGGAHDVVTNWLCSDLMEVLRPHMHGFPFKYWKISESHFSGVVVELDSPPRELVESGKDDLIGYRLQIDLVEDLNGDFRSVCWRSESRSSTVKRMQELLDYEVKQESLSCSVDGMH